MERWWAGRPEWLRWVLFLPLSFVAVLVAQFVLLLILGGAAPGPRWGLLHVVSVKILTPILIASVLAPLSFEVVYALAPRGHRVLLWLIYIPAAALFGVAFIGLVLRRLGAWGLLGDAMLPHAGEIGWETTDWGELGQSVAWLSFGTMSFRSCLRRSRSDQPAPAAPLSQTETQEVRDCLRELDLVEPILRETDVSSLYLPDDFFVVVRNTLKDSELTVQSVREEKVPARSLVWLVISNATGNALATGNYHIYRNVLSGPGHALMAVYSRAINELESAGCYAGRNRSAQQDREWTRERVREAG